MTLYRHPDVSGMALRLLDGISDSDMVRVVAVGDDHVWIVDPADLTPLADDEFCRCCGATDCEWRDA